MESWIDTREKPCLSVTCSKAFTCSCKTDLLRHQSLNSGNRAVGFDFRGLKDFVARTDCASRRSAMERNLVILVVRSSMLMVWEWQSVCSWDPSCRWDTIWVPHGSWCAVASYQHCRETVYVWPTWMQEKLVVHTGDRPFGCDVWQSLHSQSIYLVIKRSTMEGDISCVMFVVMPSCTRRIHCVTKKSTPERMLCVSVWWGKNLLWYPHFLYFFPSNF